MDSQQDQTENSNLETATLEKNIQTIIAQDDILKEAIKKETDRMIVLQNNIIEESIIEFVDVPIIERNQCEICYKNFSRISDLKEHMRTHTGMRLCCPYCGKDYAQKAGVNKHLRRANTKCFKIHEEKKMNNRHESLII